MKKGHWISLAVLAGVGVTAYFVLRKPKWRVTKMTKTDKGVDYEFKVGRETLTLNSQKGFGGETTKQVPLYSYTFATVPQKEVMGSPAVELRIVKRFGDKPTIIPITNIGQGGV